MISEPNLVSDIFQCSLVPVCKLHHCILFLFSVTSDSSWTLLIHTTIASISITSLSILPNCVPITKDPIKQFLVVYNSLTTNTSTFLFILFTFARGSSHHVLQKQKPEFLLGGSISNPQPTPPLASSSNIVDTACTWIHQISP